VPKTWFIRFFFRKAIKMSTSSLPLVIDGFDHYMAQIKRFDLISREEECELAVRYRHLGDLEAAQRLVCANLRFVVKIALEYRNYGMKLLDLIQEGNIGLMMAVKKFDPKRGIRLISYAVWWIRAYIQNYVVKTWSLVKIGTTQAQKKLFFKLKQTQATLLRLTGREDRDELARELDVRNEEIDEMVQRMAARDTSLNVELVEGESFTLLESLADETDNQETLLLASEQQQMLSSQVQTALSRLNERERQIIHDRILSDAPRTLQELADDYGISRERIRQLEKNALLKMRGALEPAFSF
jgi:RNA polymerase sigma-32 factor